MKLRIIAAITFALGIVWCCSVEAAHTQPNVLLIMADDQGWGDISSHGAQHLQTPVLDAFAKSGVRFDRFFVSPVCAPTRASLLTGRYSLRTGVRGVTRLGNRSRHSIRGNGGICQFLGHRLDGHQWLSLVES